MNIRVAEILPLVSRELHGYTPGYQQSNPYPHPEIYPYPRSGYGFFDGYLHNGPGVRPAESIPAGLYEKASPREVGKSGRAVWMANRTQVQNELEVLHCIVQVRDTLACRIISKQCMACIW